MPPIVVYRFACCGQMSMDSPYYNPHSRRLSRRLRTRVSEAWGMDTTASVFRMPYVQHYCCLRKSMFLFCTRPTMLCVVLIHLGCASPIDPGKQYSGKFRVVNNSSHDLRVVECSGFGHSSPVAGSLGPGHKKEMNYPLLSSFPDNTTITWHKESDCTVRESVVSLVGVVQPGISGTTEFTVSDQMQWTVRFVPDSGH